MNSLLLYNEQCRGSTGLRVRRLYPQLSSWPSRTKNVLVVTLNNNYRRVSTSEEYSYMVIIFRSTLNYKFTASYVPDKGQTDLFKALFTLNKEIFELYNWAQIICIRYKYFLPKNWSILVPLFNGIPTFVGYLMSKPCLEKNSDSWWGIKKFMFVLARKWT